MANPGARSRRSGGGASGVGRTSPGGVPLSPNGGVLGPLARRGRFAPGRKGYQKSLGHGFLPHTESGPKGIKPVNVMDEKLHTGYPI